MPPLQRVQQVVKQLLRAVKRLWKLPWDNSYKEVYWKLLLDGLATSLRLRQVEQHCVCGAACPGRYHHFWQCPVAHAVVAAIIAELPTSWVHVTPGVPVVTLANIWFMEAPRAGAHRLHNGVWSVVCLAAIVAMDVGRAAVSQHSISQRERSLREQRQRDMLQRRLERMHIRRQQQQQQCVPDWQPRITQFLEPASMTTVAMDALHDVAVQLVAPEGQRSRSGQSRVSQRQYQQRRISEYVQSSSQGNESVPVAQQDEQQPVAVALNDLQQLAVARFWELLADFTVLRAAPPQWVATVSKSHPFLHPDDARTKFVVERCQ